MDKGQSRFFKLVAIVVPTFAALVTGIWLEGNRLEPLIRFTRELKVHEIQAQEEGLAKQLRDELKILQTRALALSALAGTRGTAIPENPVLMWSELNASHLQFEKKGVNPSFKQTLEFQNNYLNALTRQLNLKELKTNGVAILRVQIDASHELLSFSFDNNQTGKVSSVLLEGKDAFPAFAEFKAVISSPRAYLIGSDGIALLRSEASDLHSSFVGSEVFSQAIEPLLKSERISGWGEFSNHQVLAAYSRLGSLPLAILVESRMSPVVVWNISLAEKILLGLGSLILLVALAFRSMPDALAEVAERPQVATEIPELEAAYFEAPPTNPVFHLEPSAEQIFVPVVLEEVKKSRAPTPQENVILTQLEIECLNFSKDPKKVASKMTEFAARLFGVPALFFTYHERVGASVLQAQSGEFSSPTGGMSFTSRDGLRILMRERLQADAFQAWDMCDDEGALLGILVVLSDHLSDLVSRDSQNRMVRSANRLYAESYKRSLSPS